MIDFDNEKLVSALADSNPGANSRTHKLTIAHWIFGHRNHLQIFRYLKKKLLRYKHYPKDVTEAELKALPLCDACQRAKHTKMRRRG